VVVGKSLIEKERKKNIEITGKDIFVLERNTSSTDVVFTQSLAFPS